MKYRAIESDTEGKQRELYDDRGVLRTDRVRGATPADHNGNWFTRAGMGEEGYGDHEYSPGGRFESKINQYLVTDVSKIHDWFTSVNYTSNGLYQSRSLAFDTVFQGYCFVGMLPAFGMTLAGRGGNTSLQNQLNGLNYTR